MLTAADTAFSADIEGKLVLARSPFIVYDSQRGLISAHDCMSEAALAFYTLAARYQFRGLPDIYKWQRGAWQKV